MPTIAISLGDPAGIGPEVTFKALAAGRGKLPAGARFLLFGPASAAALARDFGLPELAFTDAESFRDSGARLGIVASPVPLTPSGPAAGKIGARTGPVGKRTILRDTRSDRPVAEKASRTGRTAASPGRRGQDGTGCSPQGSADGASVQL
ncbi:MAG: hypothetical protein N3A38_15475, partial [Planctomycetota bacterium]|nr:hypothetical protein [Planctomycetota bacterium]